MWGRCINYIFCVLVLPVLIDCKKYLRIPKMVVIRSRELKEDKQHNWVRFIVFNATLDSITVISWWSVLLVEETGVPGENHRPVASHWQTLSHNAVSSTLRHELAVHRRRTNNTMAKSRWTKNKNNDRQKTLHRKLEIEQHEPRWNKGWTQMLRICRLFQIRL